MQLTVDDLWRRWRRKGSSISGPMKAGVGDRHGLLEGWGVHNFLVEIAGNVPIGCPQIPRMLLWAGCETRPLSRTVIECPRGESDIWCHGHVGYWLEVLGGALTGADIWCYEPGNCPLFYYLLSRLADFGDDLRGEWTFLHQWRGKCDSYTAITLVVVVS